MQEICRSNKMADSWSSLKGLHKDTMAAIAELKFSKMTPVQAACIPEFLSKKDVAVEAVTGSGKTLAFLIPVLEMLRRREDPLKKHEVGALVLTPTRELATQICEVLQHFLKHATHFTSALFIGGNPVAKDIETFKEKGAQIIVATPGRLEDMVLRDRSGFSLAMGLKSLEVLVLDEADRLLDLGFEASINTILGFLPKLRRTGLFSATQTDRVENLIRAGLRNPLRVTVQQKLARGQAAQRTPTTLCNSFMIVEADEKFNQLVHFLREHRKEKIMVFFCTCAGADYFSKALTNFLKSTQVLRIHGKLKKKRNKIFSDFRKLSSGVLVCTDVMARGVDIPDVHWVIQYDPPRSASSFVHRCGRTARIGNTGNALVLLLPSEDTYVKFIEINQQVPLTPLEKDEGAEDWSAKLRALATQDRAVYEKGMRAFVSFIQAYANHECSMIFRIKDLDFGKLATGFGLLRIPRMPELKGKKFSFVQSDVDVSAIPYKDKNREKLRLQRSAGEEKKKARMKKPVKTVAWSKNKEKQAKRKLKRGKKRGRDEDDDSLEEEDDDLEELMKDARLLKKFKKGKISKEEFEAAFGDELSDSD